MSKVKIVHFVEDNRQAPIRHFHMSHNAPYLRSPPTPRPPKEKTLHEHSFQFLLKQL